MDTNYRLSKIESKYHIKVLGMIDDKNIHVVRDNYEYIIPIGNLSRTKWTPSLMTSESFVNYLESKIDCPSLKIIELDRDSRRMLVKNLDTSETTWQFYYNTDSEYLLRMTTKTLTIISKLKELLGDVYDYSKVIYKGVHSPLIIGCPKHGDFITTYSNESSNKKYKGCPICAKEEIQHTAFGFRKSEFVNLCKVKNTLGKLYIIRCYSKNESFYKIGITSRSLEERVKNIPYEYEVIKLLEDDPEKIWNLEKYYHSMLKQFRYLPSKEFYGMFECFYTLNNLT
jgi:hypothetical protein